MRKAQVARMFLKLTSVYIKLARRTGYLLASMARYRAGPRKVEEREGDLHPGMGQIRLLSLLLI